MYTTIFGQLLSVSARRVAALLIGFLALVAGFNKPASAEVIGIGDVAPALPPFGGTVGEVIVGNTGTGRLVIDVPAFTDPLESAGGVIGLTPTGIGEAVITGFGSQWTVGGEFIVGDQGLAFLNIIGGGRVFSVDQLDPEEEDPVVIAPASTVIGNQAGSTGIVSITGFGSRFDTATVDVGNQGDGSIDITSRGNMVTTGDANIGVTTDSISSVSNPVGRVTVNGLGSRWTIQDTLIVGNSGTGGLGGRGILQIQNQALVQVGNLQNSDFMLVDRRGRVELAGGTLRTLTGANGQVPIDNLGAILGDGFIDGSIDNFGEIRNAASIANQREQLLITGSVLNNGVIESIGGEMEFMAPVINNNVIVARDAIMRFQGGLSGNGNIVIGGATTIYGPIPLPGNILVLSDSSGLVVGDLVLGPSSLMEFSVGSSPGTLDVVGSATLDGFMSLNYSAGGILPQPGDTYEVFSVSDSLSGTFQNDVAVAGGLIWDILYEGNTVLVSAVGAAAPWTPGSGADFNGDGVVDHLDLIIWQQNFGSTGPEGDANGDGFVDGSDFMLWQQQQGGPGAPPLVANANVVPEPSSLVLLLAALACGVTSRRRRS